VCLRKMEIGDDHARRGLRDLAATGRTASDDEAIKAPSARRNPAPVGMAAVRLN
jgi:hypothetical protein